MSVRIRFVPCDLWVGLYWERDHFYDDDGRAVDMGLRVFVCFLPCLPIIFEFGEARR